MNLEVYGNKKKLPGPFQYLGIPISIYAMERGAVHCKKQHDYRTRKCGVCNEGVAPRNIFMGFVEGRQATRDCDTLDEALRVAQKYVDSNFGDEDDDDGEKGTGMVGFDIAGAKGRSSELALETIDHLGWVSHALKLIREDEENERRTTKSVQGSRGPKNS